jgi:hypothetical protein
VEATEVNRQLKKLAEETVLGNGQLRKLARETVVVTEQLQKLTQDTVDDSATVKTITLVSAFYLPGSFIGVSHASIAQFGRSLIVDRQYSA